MRAYIFHFAPESGRRATWSACPFRAKSGSDKPYSITSSARARRDAGISIPSDFAVLRLMTSQRPSLTRAKHRLERSDELFDQTNLRLPNSSLTFLWSATKLA